MDLKPCPFCGKKPGIKDIFVLGSEYQVACNYKYCPTQPCTEFQADKKKAIEKWNKRKP